MRKPLNPHYRHRFPAGLISHAVWLYHVFSLTVRDVELILAERGVIVSCRSIRRWCLKFGASFSSNLRRRRPRPGDKWHLDEVFIRIQGELHYLWRAVGQHGIVLDILVQSRRDAGAAKRFFRRLLKGLHVEHRKGRYLNNRAENSHRPTRRRERQMQRFNRHHRRSASCRPTLSSMATSIRDVTGPQPGTSGSRMPWPSRSGPRRRAPKTQLNRAMVPASDPNTTFDR